MRMISLEGIEEINKAKKLYRSSSYEIVISDSHLNIADIMGCSKEKLVLLGSSYIVINDVLRKVCIHE